MLQRLLLFTLFCLHLPFLQAQQKTLHFENLTTRDGLSHNRVTAIFKDELGYIWLGTSVGLNRFNGYEFQVFKHESGNPNSIDNNSIYWISEGPGDEIIWIRTNSGLSAYNIYTERFVDISKYIDKQKVKPWIVNDLIKDKNENSWISTENEGLFKIINKDCVVTVFESPPAEIADLTFDLNGNVVVLYQNGQFQKLDINTNKIIHSYALKGLPDEYLSLRIFLDSSGGMWVWSSGKSIGLYYYDNLGSEPKKIGKAQLYSDVISGVIEEDKDHILVATDHGGITMIDKTDWSFHNFRNMISDDKSLSHNSAISAYKDYEGMIWIGTNKGGVNYYHPNDNFFNHFVFDGDQFGNYNEVKSILEDENGNFFIGTDGAGLLELDRKTGDYISYTHDPNDINSLSSNVIVCMERDEGGIWIGTYHGGLNYFDGEKFQRKLSDPNNPNVLPDMSIWELYKDSKGNLWVGTLQSGVIVYDPNLNKIHNFNRELGNLTSNYVVDFEEDIDGKIWIATSYGVHVFDPDSGDMRHYLTNASDASSLADDEVASILLSSDGNIWLATRGGINRYNREKDNFETYAKRDGLGSNMVVSIEEDNEGRIWVGTDKGISELVIKEAGFYFNNYDEADGLHGENFNENSSLRTNKGELVFGGVNGLNVFNPKDIVEIRKKEKLVFTEFHISNKQILPGDTIHGRPVFNSGINTTKELNLKHFENSFTLEFAALNYFNPEKILYEYMLQGFDEEWIVTTSDQRRVNYTNLDPGNYVFKVKSYQGSFEGGEEEIQMAITIQLPFWKTPISFLFYALIGLAMFLVVRKIIVDRERLKARIEHDRLESQRLHQLDLMKIKFFTNISHEFRTPLTLIITPIERIIKSFQNHEVSREFNTIYRNANRLLTLVNQLLDFRKIEAGQHILSLAGGDLVAFIKDIIDSFSDLTFEKHIDLTLETNLVQLITQFDKDKMGKIIFNLLSNAIKFTHDNGEIKVVLSAKPTPKGEFDVEIKVIDNGIGIAADKIDQVFNRFFQVDVSGNFVNHGSGIGLSITKEFVELHGGKIGVTNGIIKGTIFTINLPMKQYQANNVNDEQLLAEIEGYGLEENIYEPDNTKYSIVIVEDNDDFRFYLKDNLKQHFNVIEADNGRTAWKLILDQKPDLVVSDIMMPIMNGLELTEKIKSDPRTMDLPIILLSAHSSDQRKIEGLQAGAIEHISKPFNFEILVNSIRSALKFREQVRQTEHQIDVSPSTIEVTSLDEKLIQNALEIVEENMANPDFSVQELSKGLGVSRGQLYKKLLAITGQTPIEFIRSIRLKRSKSLLEKSQLTVSEVAYKVGFNNPRYFTKYFKERYKVLPSKFLKDNQPEKN